MAVERDNLLKIEREREREREIEYMLNMPYYINYVINMKFSKQMKYININSFTFCFIRFSSGDQCGSYVLYVYSRRKFGLNAYK